MVNKKKNKPMNNTYEDRKKKHAAERDEVLRSPRSSPPTTCNRVAVLDQGGSSPGGRARWC